MSFFTYVAKSTIKAYFYKGHCQVLETRIKEHNSGMTKSLRHYLPMEIVYFEEFPTLSEAILREKFFKTAAGRRYIKKILNSKIK